MSSESRDFSQDRRKQPDRRAADRQGKYDRRRNRCGHCSHFALRPAQPGEGFCSVHEQTVWATDFACPAFAPDENSV